MELKCDIHSSFVATYYCTDCNSFFCKICCRVGDHFVVPLSEFIQLERNECAPINYVREVSNLMLKYNRRIDEGQAIHILQRVMSPTNFLKLKNELERIESMNVPKNIIENKQYNSDAVQILSDRIAKLELNQKEAANSVGKIIAEKIDQQLKKFSDDRYKVTDDILSIIQPKIDKFIEEINSKVDSLKKSKINDIKAQLTTILNDVQQISTEQLPQKNEIIVYLNSNIQHLSTNPKISELESIEIRAQEISQKIKCSLEVSKLKSDIIATISHINSIGLQELDASIGQIKEIEKKVESAQGNSNWETVIASAQKDLAGIRNGIQDMATRIKEQKTIDELSLIITKDSEKYTAINPKVSEVGKLSIEKIKAGTVSSSDAIKVYCKEKNNAVVSLIITKSLNRIDPTATKAKEMLNAIKKKYIDQDVGIEGYNKHLSLLTQEVVKIEEQSKSEAAEKAQPNLIFYSQEKGLSLVIYDPAAGGKLTFKLSNRLNVYAESISVGRRIFFIGGDVPIVDTVVEVNLSSTAPKEVIAASMIKAKCYHALCTINDFIFSVGGFNNESLDDCQLYSVSKNVWHEFHSLKVARRSPAVFIWNRDYIYCLGGNLNNNHIGAVERASLLGKTQWESISTVGLFQGRSNVHGIQISKSEVIIFGGFIGHMNLNTSVILNINGNSHQFVAGASLKLPSQFYCTSAPVFLNGVLYGVDYKRNLHMFSTKTKDWTLG